MASPSRVSPSDLQASSPAKSRSSLSSTVNKQIVIPIEIDSTDDDDKTELVAVRDSHASASTSSNGVVKHDVIDVIDVTDDLHGLKIKTEAISPSPSVLAAATSAASDTAASAHPPLPPPPSKPKSKAPKPPRSPSPSPPPALPPPRLETIRLEITLGGPDNYAVDIAQLAKETGQRPSTPTPLKRDTSDSEGDDEGDGSKKRKGKGKGKKKNLASEYYDLNDPFIDDSELATDERTYFAQTKQHGFYVSSGEVALLKEKVSPTKKPKSKRLVPMIIPLAGSQVLNSNSRPPLSTSASALAAVSTSSAMPSPGTASVFIKEGTRDSPIALGSDAEDGMMMMKPMMSISPSGLKRKSSMDSQSQSGSVNGGAKKKRKLVEIETFHPELQNSLNDLKAAIGAESFEQKGKFPPSLKPILADVALVAIRCGEYNDNFFSLMPKLFPYNKFTMTKLIKRTVYAEHHKMLVDRQDELVTMLGRLVDEGFPKAQEEYEKGVASWHRRHEKEKSKADAASSGGIAGTATAGQTSTESTPAPHIVPLPLNNANGNDGESEVDHDGPDGQEGATAREGKGAHPPGKKYRLTEQMKAIIWELVVLSNEAVRIENEKHGYEGSTVQISEQGARKVLYQRIVSCFPDGWMSSGQISRDVSVMKKRFEAQQQEE